MPRAIVEEDFGDKSVGLRVCMQTSDGDLAREVAKLTHRTFTTCGIQLTAEVLTVERIEDDVSTLHEFSVEMANPIANDDTVNKMFGSIFMLIHQCDTTLRLERHCRPVLTLSSLHFFRQTCVAAHLNVPAQAVYFGNMLNNGAMGVHWMVYYGDIYGGLLQDKIVVLFEYDRSSISIKFRNVERYMKDGDRKIEDAEYTIKIALEGIRRIIVDPMCLLPGVPPKHRKTRFHFELNMPPEIWRFVEQKNSVERFGDGNRQPYMQRGTDYTGHSNNESVNDSTVVSIEFIGAQPPDFYTILSRLRRRAGVPIEFAMVDLIHMLIEKERDSGSSRGEANYPYVHRNPLSLRPYSNAINTAIPRPHNEQKSDKRKRKAEKFRLKYALEALFSRGASVRDQLWVSEVIWKRFLNLVTSQYIHDSEVCQEALEALLNRIDEQRLKKNIMAMFLRCVGQIRHAKNSKLLNNNKLQKEGYVRVRKIVVTPSRHIYIAPEMLMGNRVLRTYDPMEVAVLRVQFRDENSRPLRPNVVHPHLIEVTIGDALRNGIKAGGRIFRYLGSSNSQMRDNGAYFMYSTTEKYIMDIRRSLGRFENLDNIPKFMARMGQCFTQSVAVQFDLSPEEYDRMYDIIGGPLDNDKSYTFSDGVGQIALAYAKKICADQKLGPSVPSCYQFRYRGNKGVLTVTPHLDDMNKFYKEQQVKPSHHRSSTKEFKEIFCRFRPSQIKFEDAEEGKFEMVKYSAPTPVALNKQLINIMDQVSEMQSYKSHRRICARIEELLERQLTHMSQTLIQEKECRNKLKELPRRVSIDVLSQSAGFNLTVEPYFRSLLKAAVRFMILKQLNKEQIAIPIGSGRSLFGVVDETGLLQYGQIFVQCSINCLDKIPKVDAKKIIVKGTVLMTKNPCIVSGDVRIFEAVDIPELHHLVDVVVFPQYGPRPHPDEMAGSDLDGDEYTVIWDDLLLFDRNEPAMNFPKKASKMNINPEMIGAQMVRFYVDYVKLDSVGMIANAHLVNSDLYGLNSEVCRRVAIKHSEAVDFPKSGAAPDKLTFRWDENSKPPVPPEKAERKPDFMQKNRDPCYASRRLVGRLFRDIKLLEETLTISEEKANNYEIDLDPLIDEPNWQNYKAKIDSEYNNYYNQMISLMEYYGVATEGELMSGCISTIRNRVSDRDADDMSMFTTNQVIEDKASAIFRMYRQRFFEEFGGYENCTEVEKDRAGIDDHNICHRVVVEAREPRMRQKAVAMYKICYDRASKQHDNMPRILSFAWLAFDVLAYVKRRKIDETPDYPIGSDPFEEIMEGHIARLCDGAGDRLAATTEFLCRQNDAINRYVKSFRGLDRIAYVLVSWCERESLFTPRFTVVHIVLLFIQYCVNHYCELINLRAISMTRTDTMMEGERVREFTQMGRTFVGFLHFLSSRMFRNLQHVEFSRPGLGFNSVFVRGEWLPLHRAAIRAYYGTVFSLRFELDKGFDAQERIEIVPDREMIPFVIELPLDAEMGVTAKKIEQLAGARQVQLRRMPTGNQTRVVVSAVGSLESHSKIRDLLVIAPPTTSGSNDVEVSTNIPHLILERINSMSNTTQRRERTTTEADW